MKKFLSICATLVLTFGLGLMLTACGGGFSDAFTSYAKSKGVSTKFQTMTYSESGTNRSVTAHFSYEKNALGNPDTNKPQFSVVVAQGQNTRGWWLTDGTIYYSNSATSEKFFLPYFEEDWDDLTEFVSIFDDAYAYVSDTLKTMGNKNEHSLVKTEDGNAVNFEANARDLVCTQNLKVDFVDKQLVKIVNHTQHNVDGETTVEISTFEGSMQFPDFSGYADGSLLDEEKFSDFLATLGKNFTAEGFDYYSSNAQTNGKAKFDGVAKDVYLERTGGESLYHATNEKIWLETGRIYYQFDEDEAKDNKISALYDEIVLDKDNKNQPIKRAKEAVEKVLAFQNLDLKDYFDSLFAQNPLLDKHIKWERKNGEDIFEVELSRAVDDYIKVVVTLQKDQLVKFETFNRTTLTMSIKPLTSGFPYLQNGSSFQQVSGN